MFTLFQTSSISLFNIFAAFLSSAALGSVIALIGIWRQNLAQFKQQKTAREMELRRDIYLLGAEALGKMQQHLVSFANPTADNTVQDSIVTGVNETINKVAMIASIDILGELDRIQDHYSHSLVGLVTRKMEFTRNVTLLKGDEDTQSNIAQNLAQITAALNTANQNQDKQGQSELINRFRQLDSLFKQNEIQLREKREGMLIDILKFVDYAIEASIKFDELAVPLNVMVRIELGFPLDEEQYRAILNESSRKLRKRAQDMKQQWHQIFKEDARNHPFNISL